MQLQPTTCHFIQHSRRLCQNLNRQKGHSHRAKTDRHCELSQRREGSCKLRSGKRRQTLNGRPRNHVMQKLVKVFPEEKREFFVKELLDKEIIIKVSKNSYGLAVMNVVITFTENSLTRRSIMNVISKYTAQLVQDSTETACCRSPSINGTTPMMKFTMTMKTDSSQMCLNR